MSSTLALIRRNASYSIALRGLHQPLIDKSNGGLQLSLAVADAVEPLADAVEPLANGTYKLIEMYCKTLVAGAHLICHAALQSVQITIDDFAAHLPVRHSGSRA